jgi:hypothetical protein
LDFRKLKAMRQAEDVAAKMLNLTSGKSTLPRSVEFAAVSGRSGGDKSVGSRAASEER